MTFRPKSTGVRPKLAFCFGGNIGDGDTGMIKELDTFEITSSHCFSGPPQNWYLIIQNNQLYNSS
jgi:hypothetical protein